MSIFDPFGFLSNIHVNAKILIQETWKLTIGWDESVPDDISKKWYQWQTELDELKNLKIPRCYSLNISIASNIQLHIFVHASLEAFAAVSYWRIESENGVELSFIYGKSRVAPRKPLTVPRMELQAAILGVRMKQAILESHSIKPLEIFLWSDSTTVCHWINAGSKNGHKYKPYVAHRISEILEATSPMDWHWVPTQMNVADEATRAKFPIRYNCNSKWFFVTR